MSKKNEKKHRPPSRIRYEESHPTISFRLEKSLRDELNSFLQKNNLSKPDFIKIFLKKQKENYEAVRTDAYDKGLQDGKKSGREEGYEEGKKDWAIWVNCYNCLAPVYIMPNTKDHETLIKAVRGYFCHKKCSPEQLYYNP